MLASMKKLAALPPETTVYCGHEYHTFKCPFSRSRWTLAMSS